MGVDVALRLGPGVAPEQVGNAVPESADHTEHTGRRELGFVGEKKPGQTHEVGARPVAVDIGLPGADVGSAQQTGEEPPTVDIELHDGGGASAAAGEGPSRTVGQPHHQVPSANAGQSVQDDPSRERRTSGSIRMVGDGLAAEVRGFHWDGGVPSAGAVKLGHDGSSMPRRGAPVW